MDTGNKLKLLSVTLVSVACTKVPETIEALRKSMENIEFKDTILITHEELSLDGIRVINIPKLDYKSYNEFIAYRLKDYIHTDFCLAVQNDGYVINRGKWSDDFLDYDYIGAPWKALTHFTEEGKEVRVGNGGFSFRSKRLLDAPSELNLPFTDKGTGYYHEDGLLCVYYRKELEEYGIKYAPMKIAAQFSHEIDVGEDMDSFGFHRYL